MDNSFEGPQIYRKPMIVSFKIEKKIV